MAANSKREQILSALVTKLGEISAITTVRRVAFTDIKELDDCAETELPVAVVVGGLPVPDEKFSTRIRRLDATISTLNVDVFVYAQDNTDPDTTVSSLADDIWAKIYADFTLGISQSNVSILELAIIPTTSVLVLMPYVAFKMTIAIKYRHGKEGI